MSLNLPDAERMVGGGEEGRQGLHGHAHAPLLVRRTARFAAGSRTARFTCTTWSSRPISSAATNLNMHGQPRSWVDNLLWHHGCHSVDLAQWILNEPNCEVWGQKGPDHPELGIPMDMTVAMKSKKGPLFTHGDVVQQQGAVRRLLPLHRRRGDLQGLPRLDDRQRRQGSAARSVLAFDRQDIEFVSAIREGREPESSAASCLPTMALLDRIDKAMNGRLVGRQVRGQVGR